MIEALGWGAVAASSLAIGASVGLAGPWPRQVIGLVRGFGAGALISAVNFELAQEGVEVGGTEPVAAGLAVGALAYVVAAGRVDPAGGGNPRKAGSPSPPAER